MGFREEEFGPDEIDNASHEVGGARQELKVFVQETSSPLVSQFILHRCPVDRR